MNLFWIQLSLYKFRCLFKKGNNRLIKFMVQGGVE